jgi:hypothetical protein
MLLFVIDGGRFILLHHKKSAERYQQDMTIVIQTSVFSVSLQNIFGVRQKGNLPKVGKRLLSS